MKLHRPRFTVRRMMVAVAIAAVSTWGAQAAFRWRDYRTRADVHASEQTRLRAELAPYVAFKGKSGRFPGCGTFQYSLMVDLERAEWHALLEAKYRRASLRPWLPVAPDPPAPE
jgi:hypothetical protein